jgi:hypothetical protein
MTAGYRASARAAGHSPGPVSTPIDFMRCMQLVAGPGESAQPRLGVPNLEFAWCRGVHGPAPRPPSSSKCLVVDPHVRCVPLSRGWGASWSVLGLCLVWWFGRGVPAASGCARGNARRQMMSGSYTREVCTVVGACAAPGASIVVWACTRDTMQHRPHPAPTLPLRRANANL